MIHVIGGLPKTMKTWIALDLAVEISRGGGQWCGKFPVSGGNVLFLDQERPIVETGRRLSALFKAKGSDPEKASLRYWNERGLKFSDDRSYERIRKEIETVQPTIFMVDSFVTAFGGDENNRNEVQRCFDRVKQLRTDFKCAIVFIDHEKKDTYHDKEDGVLPSMGALVGSVGKSAALERCFSVRRHDARSSFVYDTGSTLADTAAPFLVSVKDHEDGGRSVEAM